VRCCGKILCAGCGIQGTKLTRYGKAVEGKCPNCRARIAFTDLIFINGNFDLDSIITDTPEYKQDIKRVENVKINNTKLSVLMNIINNKPDARQKKNVVIAGMLEGINELPEAPVDKRKIIVFSKFEESLNSLETQLKTANVCFRRLGGTSAQIHATATEFQDTNNIKVLLINGEKYASGLNLQSSTDLVFMHKIVDRNIEAQIIGRIQRLGRQYKAHIHYILYEDEVAHMQYAN
jgi:SNF2 family DNA or RNA helicase